MRTHRTPANVHFYFHVIFRPLFSSVYILSFFFFFNDTATTEIYTLSLHDALPISVDRSRARDTMESQSEPNRKSHQPGRSEEHTSELQSQFHLVCRLLLEKKKKNKKNKINNQYKQYKKLITINKEKNTNKKTLLIT